MELGTFLSDSFTVTNGVRQRGLSVHIYIRYLCWWTLRSVGLGESGVHCGKHGCKPLDLYLW